MSDKKQDFNMEDAGRKLQLALIRALYKQIYLCPEDVPASTLAVAERMLARWNLGMIEIPEDESMTEEELQMIRDFKEMSMGIDTNLFETLQ